MMLRALAAALLIAGAAGAGERQVDGLSGTWLAPDGARAAVVILPGSGPTDRDGNQPGLRTDALKRLAEALAGHGIASLRADKRGVGASAAAAPAEADLRLGTYVADAAAWARAVADWHGAPPVLLGHSEGALVATLAAGQAPVAGLVLLAGAGHPADVLIARQLAEAGLPADLAAASARIAAALKSGLPVADVPAVLMPLYRPSVQPYMMSWLPLDPAAELARLPAALPVLVVGGTTDLQTGADEARVLAAARPGAELALIGGMNHVLRRAPADRAANLATYAQPDLPLAPGLAETLARFIAALP